MKHETIEGLTLSLDEESNELLASEKGDTEPPFIVFGPRTTVDPEFAPLFYMAVSMYRCLTASIELLQSQNSAFAHIQEAGILISTNNVLIEAMRGVQELARGETAEVKPNHPKPLLRLVN